MHQTSRNSGLIYILLAASLLLTVSSCEYNPTGVYERETVSNPISPEIQAIELYLNEDTVFFYTTQMKINFNFRSSDQKIIYVRFLVDGIQKSVIESNSGQFSFENIGLPQGIHSLQMDVFTHSGSSSIADILGMEGFLFSKNWVLKSENFLDKKTIIETEDGYLKLTFPQYKNPDLVEYIVSRDINANTMEIARIKDNVFIDSTYIGEGGSYKVIVRTASGLNLNWNEVFLDKELPLFSLYATDDNTYSFKWAKCKYYSALQNYSILFRNHTSSEEFTISVTDPSDTIINLPDLRFNDLLYIILRSIPRAGNPFYNSQFYPQFQTSKSCRAGIPSSVAFPEEKAFPINEDEFVYSCAGMIYRSSVSQNKALDSRGYTVEGCYRPPFSNLKVSPNGSYITAYVGCDNDIFSSSSFDFQNYSISNLSYLTGHASPSVAVSDIGTGVIAFIKHVYLYDFENSQMLDTVSISVSPYRNSEISSDGNYCIFPADSLRLYKIHNNQLELLWKTRLPNTVFYAFSPLNKYELVLWVNSMCYIKDCKDFSTIREFPLSASKVFNVDFYKNQMLAYAADHLLVISILDGSVLYDIPVNFSLSTYGEDCFLLNNQIFARNSVSYKLN